MPSDPIVIDPPYFDQAAAWRECGDWVETCGGMAHEDGSPNMRAASGADPGVCACPVCGEYYWAWGFRQRCAKCGFEYPTDWWPMYSWGCAATSRKSSRFDHERRMEHPYYRYGFEHPADEPWRTCRTREWRDEIRAAMTKGAPHA